MKRTSLLILLILTTSLLTACAGGGYTASSWTGITVDEEAQTAYVAYGQYVYAINLADGSQRWRYPEKGDANKTFFSAPVITADGQLMVGSYDHKLYSLDLLTGVENQVGWPFPTNHRIIASPLVTELGIFVPSANGSLYALKSNGQSLWTAPFETQGALWSQPVADPECECIYLGSMDHHLYVIDAATGQVKWDQPTDLGGAVVGAPTYAEGKLYVGTFASEMLTIDAASGQIVSRFATDGWVWGGPAWDEEQLYFGDIKGNFYHVDAAANTLVKKTVADGAIVSTPLVSGDTVYFTTETGTLYAYQNEGLRSQTIAQTDKKEKLYSAPVAAGDIILVAPVGGDRLLVALNPDLSQKWVFIPPK